MKKVIDYYENPVDNEQNSRFSIWEKGEAFGNSMTPSSYYLKYRVKLVNLLKKLLYFTPGKKVLSIGCGNAFVEADLTKIDGVEVIASDVSEEAIAFAKKKGLKVKYIDAKKDIVSPPNSVDLLLLEGVIGHLFNDTDSLNNIISQCYKALKPQGAFFIGNEAPTNGESLQLMKYVHFYRTSEDFLTSALMQKFESVQSTLVPYKRPDFGIMKRVWCWGFKPTNKFAIPDFTKIQPYKKENDIFSVPLSEDAPYSYVILKPCAIISNHKHDFTYHEIYVIKGDLKFTVDNRTFVVSENSPSPKEINSDYLKTISKVCVHPGQFHSVKNIGNYDAEVLCYDNPAHK